MEYLKNKLNKFVYLHDVKKIKKKYKKIVNTCVYIPSELDYNERSIYYFQGLVKSVETFNDVMNKGGDKWIYRVYYDKMFDSAISFTYKKKKAHKMTKKHKKIEMKRRKRKSKKKKQKAKELGSISNEYNYAFNHSVYDMSTEDMDKMYLYEDFKTRKSLNRTFKGTAKIKKNLIDHEDSFKKLLKLYHLYIKKIKKNKGNKYDNIELVRYDCPIIKSHPQFIGHSSSFGMFLRFCPLLDKDVSLYYSVNSTHPITPQLAHIVKKWSSNDNLNALAICYNTRNIANSSKKYIIDNVEKIKKKTNNKQALTTFEMGFVNIIDQIFSLNNSLSFNNVIKATPNVNNIINRINKNSKLSFNKIKKFGMDERYIFNLNRHSLPTYSYSNLLYNNNIELFDEAIGGGMFGLKRGISLLYERYEVFINFVILLLENKINLSYGLDELLLKIILLPDIHIAGNRKMLKHIQYIRLNKYIVECESGVKKLFTLSSSYLRDSKNNKIILNPDITDEMNIYYYEFFYNSWLYLVDHFDSRELYIKEDKTKIGKSEKIVININNDSLCFDSLFIGFNEPKKLLIVDKKIDKTFFHSRNRMKKTLTGLFKIIYIQDYNIGDIDKLLRYMVSYYSLNVVQPNIVVKE